MLGDRALGEAVDASFVDVFRRLADRDGGFVSQFGSVEVAAMGLTVGFFNPIFVLEPLVAGHDLAAALTALRARQLPFVVHIRGDLDDASVSVARELGLKETAVLPGMALPLPATTPAALHGLRVEPIIQTSDYSAGLAVAAEAFGMPLPFAVPECHLSPSVLERGGTLHALCLNDRKR